MRSDERFGDREFPHIFATGLEAECQPGDGLFLDLSVSSGHRIARDELVMGRERSVEVNITVKPWERLVVTGALEHVRSDAVSERRRLYRATVARTRWSMQATRELSLRLVVQYDDDDRTWEVDPLLTYRIDSFSIFYLGSTRRYGEYDADAPLPGWHLGERQYFVKLQYLWRV